MLSSDFFSRAAVQPDGCWLWPTTNSTGYGQVYLDGSRKPQKAHRAAWRIANGPIPDGLMVCHTCDVRRCVNPSHLFLGTAADNARDSVRKGRWIHRGAVKAQAQRHE